VFGKGIGGKTMRLVPYRRNESPARERESRIFPEVSRFFDDFFNDFPMMNSRENWLPAVDILEKDGEMILRCEIPGMSEKDIDLKLEGNVLTLKGEKKLDHEEGRDNYHRVESFYGTFSRSFTLPETVDTGKIKADYKNGVLTVTIPQKPEVRPREIPVNV
jgi:HSP20 family protein